MTAQVMRQVRQLAEYPAKLIERNPIPANAMPRVHAQLALPANGRSEEWIRRRTGHTSRALERYRRVASTLAELTPGDWTPLDRAIPELAAVAAAGGGFSGSSPQRTDGRNHQKVNDSAQSGRRDSNPRPLDPQADFPGVFSHDSAGFCGFGVPKRADDGSKR